VEVKLHSFFTSSMMEVSGQLQVPPALLPSEFPALRTCSVVAENRTFPVPTSNLAFSSSP